MCAGELWYDDDDVDSTTSLLSQSDEIPAGLEGNASPPVTLQNPGAVAKGLPLAQTWDLVGVHTAIDPDVGLGLGLDRPRPSSGSMAIRTTSSFIATPDDSAPRGGHPDFMAPKSSSTLIGILG